MSQAKKLVHLVGSIPLENAASVFETVSCILGGNVKRIPDGETGDRSNWIAWQLPLLELHPSIEADPEIAEPSHVSADDGLAVDARSFRFLRIKPGVGEADLDLSSEYAEHALASFRKFAELQEAGKIPADVRFQVSLPTPWST